MRQRFARIAAFGHGRLTAEHARGHGAFIDQVFGRFGRGIVIDVELARFDALLAFESGEETDPAVVIVLGPPVEGMVVTLGALDPHAEEKLGEVGREALGRESRAMHQHGVEIRGSRGEIAAGTGDLIGDEFIQRPVLRDLVVNPVVVHGGSFGVGLIGRIAAAFDAQHLGP